MKGFKNPWVIQINDSYCTYEYTFEGTNENVCIRDLACLVAGAVGAPELPEGRFISRARRIDDCLAL